MATHLRLDPRAQVLLPVALGVIANTDILRMLLQWRAHNTTRASDVMEFA